MKNTDDFNLIDAYIKHGWHIIAIDPFSKRPQSKQWNRPGSRLTSANQLPDQCGVGLCHAFSGTMCLDIDNVKYAKALLNDHGIDLNQLLSDPNAVILDSTRDNRSKLLFTLPDKQPIPTVKLKHGRVNALEFRCGTRENLSVQDVLPPSVHPVTRRPYRWAGNGNWRNAPVLPGNLIKLWHEVLGGINNLKRSKTLPVVDSPEFEDVVNAIVHIPPDIGRDDWITVGMSLHWFGNQNDLDARCFELWNTWSRGTVKQPSAKYKGVNDLRSAWRSFRREGRTIRSLFKLAREHGWEPNQKEINFLFDTLLPHANIIDNPLNHISPSPPPLDLNLWPETLAQRAEMVSESVGCDPLVPLLSGLACASGAIDNRTRLELAPGFTVPPTLWVMIIGQPSDKKSPGSRPMRKALRQLEQNDAINYKINYDQWQIKEGIHAKQRKRLIAELSENPLGSLPDLPAISVLEDEPVRLRLLIQDITSARLVQEMQKRPEGCLCWLDESSGWIRKLTDSKNGEDRSIWVSAYESEPFIMDRVGAGDVHCENLAISIYANVQPRVLAEHINNLSNDGLIQRFILSPLRASHTHIGNPIPDVLSNEPEWIRLIERLHALKVQTYTLSSEGYDCFREFQKWHIGYMKDNVALQEDANFQTAVGKAVGLAGRLILVNHMMTYLDEPIVSRETVERSISIMRQFIIPCLHYVYHTMMNHRSFDQWLMNHILAHADDGKIALSEIRISARRQISDLSIVQRDLLIRDSMELIESYNWVALAKQSRGQATWYINPNLKTMYQQRRRRVLIARQRRLEENRKNALKGVDYIEERYTPGFVEEFGLTTVDEILALDQ
ncbi:MAG: DUF3987 domain-containing protein [Candidatus Thiodiazotropha endolucinida]|nr:DUF3987 domain-containing protein [Candidatus Thiodiazotropha taylori]MCW4344857.1 DUF3987 domain-containing protein [Candidatus Thiodiazotropha endolucinida]